MSQKGDAANFFDGFAESFDSLYTGQRTSLMRWIDQRFRQDMFIRYALSFEALGPLEGKSVLDIGCGSGPYVLEALKRGASHVTALDPAPGMLALVRERLAGTDVADRCALVEGAFPGTDLRPHDHVIVMGVLDYVADPLGFFKALRPLVREKAVLSLSSRHWFRTPLRKIRYRLRHCPVFFYDEPQIRKLCASAGFGQVHVHKIPGAGLDYHICVAP